MSRGFNVGILLTTDGYVAEGSIESIFMVKDNVLKTPPLGNILSSVTRMSMLEAASAIGIKTLEEQISPEELMGADEIFVCRTGVKVLPVRKIEERVMAVAPGPVTSELSQLMSDIYHFRNDRFSHWLQAIG